MRLEVGHVWIDGLLYLYKRTPKLCIIIEDGFGIVSPWTGRVVRCRGAIKRLFVVLDKDALNQLSQYLEHRRRVGAAQMH